MTREQLDELKAHLTDLLGPVRDFALMVLAQAPASALADPEPQPQQEPDSGKSGGKPGTATPKS